MTNKNKKELIAFIERFAKGQWTELADGTIEVSGNLDCSNNQLTSLPDNLKVSGTLYCSNNQLTSLPDNLKVGGTLYCSNNQLTSLPDNLKVGGTLYCSNNQLTSLPDNLKVSGGLDCSNNQLTSLPDNLKVSGGLDCSNNQLTSLPDNLKVGGTLYCSNNQLTSLPDNLKVGGTLYCSNNQLTGDELKPLTFDEFEVGDDYIYADGILSELENVKTSNGLTIYKCVFGYVASDGTYHAHGKTLRQAVTDLNFKKDKRDPSAYKDLDLDAKRTVEEVTVIYRTITGACSAGCEMFINSNVKQKAVTLRKAIELTANQYGGKQFAGFYGVTI